MIEGTWVDAAARAATYVCGVWVGYELRDSSLPMSLAPIVPTPLKSMIANASFSSLISCFEKLKLLRTF